MGNSSGGHRLATLMIVVAAMVAATVMVIGLALDTGTARAATPTRATIEATRFTVGPVQVGEEFAVCPGTKRALGGGVVQSGNSFPLTVLASGPLDATGVTLNTNDGDIAKQWYTSTYNFSEALREFKVFAICE